MLSSITIVYHIKHELARQRIKGPNSPLHLAFQGKLKRTKYLLPLQILRIEKK